MKNIKHATAISVLLIGLVGFLYPLAVAMRKWNDYSIYADPVKGSDIIQCAVFGLLAIGMALGINVRGMLLDLFGNVFNFKTREEDKVSDKTRIQINREGGN